MTMRIRNGLVIHTNCWAKPIPDRNYDWSAVLDGYEPGGAIGGGPTEEAAIADLLEQLEDNEQLRYETETGEQT